MAATPRSRRAPDPTWSPPDADRRPLAHRFAAATVALVLGIGGSLAMASAASAEELLPPVDTQPSILADQTEPANPDPPADPAPGDAVTDPVLPADPTAPSEPSEPSEPSAPSEPNADEPILDDSARSTLDIDSTIVAITKVEFCHATSSEKNPYTHNNTSVNAFFNSGHNDHDDDIVPPFWYMHKDKLHYFPGSNWDGVGQMIWNNDCEIPEPGVQVTPDQCVPGGETGGVSVMLSSLVPGLHYRVSVRDDDKDPIDGIDDETFTADAGTETVMFSGLPAPGSYWVYVTRVLDDDDDKNGEHRGVWVPFALDECPPLIPTVTVTPAVCTVPGGTTGSATITLGSLTEDEEYLLTIYDAHGVVVSSFAPYEFTSDGSVKQVMVSGLPAPGTYRAVLEWMDDEMWDGEDDPESSSKRPPREHHHSIETWFSLGACPPVPPKLAHTGLDVNALPLGVGLMAIGSALVVGARVLRRQTVFPSML